MRTAEEIADKVILPLAEALEYIVSHSTEPDIIGRAKAALDDLDGTIEL